ncbi:MAG: MFS transporter [Microbacterium sp.]
MLFWGLQFAFLNPVLALLLVALYQATPAEVGWVLAAYNTSGFVASLALPAYADRRREYLRPMLLCGILALLMAGVLVLTTSLPVAVAALVILGGPAGVGSSLLFAHLKASGAHPSDVIGTRAVYSFAWVAGPPLAAIVMGVFGDRALLLALAAVVALNIATTALMARRRTAPAAAPPAAAPPDGPAPVGVAAVGAIVIGFSLLQGTNSAAVSMMSLFVTQSLGLPLVWSGVVLGVCALLEIPALLAIGRLSRRLSSLVLIVTGCLAGIAYYAGVALVTGPVVLLLLQILNAWFYGVVAGVGLTLFQQIIARPGLASGLFANTVRIGSVISGPMIALASSAAGYRGIFAVCAVLTIVALVVVAAAQRLSRRRARLLSPGGFDQARS